MVEVEHLPAPLIIGCCFRDEVRPAVPVLELAWPNVPTPTDGWRWPDGTQCPGPLPKHFSVRILRTSVQHYAVGWLWDKTYAQWNEMPRRALLGSCLSGLLRALGTDLAHLLDQPLPIVVPEPPPRGPRQGQARHAVTQR
jgi:hypothetical protein